MHTMPSPITSGFSKFGSNTAISLHTLEGEQALALRNRDYSAGLLNQQSFERVQCHNTNKMQQFGVCRFLSILMDHLLRSRFPKNVIAISAIDQHITEEHNFSSPKVRRYLIESEGSLSKTIADYGYALQDGVDSLFSYQTEAPRVVNSTRLSILMFV